MRYALLEYSRVPLPPDLTYQQTAAQHSLDVWTCGPAHLLLSDLGQLAQLAGADRVHGQVRYGRSVDLRQLRSASGGLNGAESPRSWASLAMPAGVAACRLGCLDPLRLLRKAVGAVPNRAHDRIVARRGTAGTARHGAARHGAARSVAAAAGEARRGSARQCPSHDLAVLAL